MLQLFMEISDLQHLLPIALLDLQCAVCTSPAMFSANTLLAELKANEQLLVARDMDPKLANGLTQQATYKLTKMHGLTSPDVVMLLDHLKDSKLPAQMKQAITNELDNLMMGHNNMANKVTTTASACDWLNKYLTKEDWCQLEASNAWQGCIVLAKRLRAMGIKSLKESTRRAGVAILLCIQSQQGNKQLPPYIAMYNLVEHLTQALASQPDAPCGVPCFQVYPKDPMSLGTDVLQMVYQEQKPEARYFDQMALLMAHHIPVRSTSKLLKSQVRVSQMQPCGNGKGQTSVQENVPAPSPSALQPNAFAVNLQQWNAQQKQQVPSQVTQPSNDQVLPLQNDANAHTGSSISTKCAFASTSKKQKWQGYQEFRPVEQTSL
eukprot:s1377_g22.t1